MALQSPRLRILLVAAVLAATGCARVNDTGMRLVSTKVDAYLMVNKQWLVGEVLLIPDRTGRAVFTADKGDISRCSGSLRYTGTTTMDMNLSCNDGTQLTLQGVLQGETRGYGYGATAQGPASVAFGMDEDEAQAFTGRLAPPATTPPAPPAPPAPEPTP